MPLTTTIQTYLNTLYWQTTDSPCFVRGVARRQFLRSPSFPVPCILTWPKGQREPEKAEMGRHLESLQHCKRLPDFLSSPKRHMKSNLIPISNLHCRVSDFLTSLYLRFMSFPLSSCVGSVHFPSQYEVKESLTTFRRVFGLNRSGAHYSPPSSRSCCTGMVKKGPLYRDRFKSWYMVWWNLFQPLLS